MERPGVAVASRSCPRHHGARPIVKRGIAHSARLRGRRVEQHAAQVRILYEDIKQALGVRQMPRFQEILEALDDGRWTPAQARAAAKSMLAGRAALFERLDRVVFSAVSGPADGDDED